MRSRSRPIFVALLLAGALGGCQLPSDEVTAWRVRADDSLELNDDGAWSGPDNATATVPVDHVFRVRFEVQRADSTPARLRLEARRNGGAWMPVEAHDHPYPDESASPVTSIARSDEYSHGEPAEDLIGTTDAPFGGGSGISLRPSPLLRSGAAGSTEWEWPLVIRYFSDGATQVAAGVV